MNPEINDIIALRNIGIPQLQFFEEKQVEISKPGEGIIPNNIILHGGAI